MDSDTSGPDEDELFSFPRLLTVAAGLTFSLILIGIYTAVAGAGLTCEGRWPLCDGWLGLFPANWPSFIEWFHRLIALPTGFLLLGLAVSAWRGGRSKRVRYALTAAVAILPSQIVLGGLTVLEYEVLYLTAHFLTAILIFALVIAATAWSLESRFERPPRLAALAVGALVPPFVVATPFVISIGSMRLHMLYYGVGLLAFSALIALALWVRDGAELDGTERRIAAAAGAGTVVLGLTMLQLRLPASPTEMAQVSGSAALVAVLSLLAVWWTLRFVEMTPADRPL